ncbi:MAG: ABC transporter ATP-binding protein [Phycisphaerales bacterium]
MSAIVTEELTRRYGARRGVEDVNLRVPEGSVFGFLGPNGAGKTTTIRVLLGFLRPSGGRATVLGMDCWKQSRRVKREVGYVPGDLRLSAWMDGRSALSLFGAVRGVDLTPGGNRLAELLELDLRVKVRRMSRGMRQKLGLILAMAHDPRVLVLDEPTSALDPLMQDRLRGYLRERARAGTTVFFSSHTLGEVESLCDRVAIVRNGRIVADSTLAELQRNAGHEVTIHWRGAAPTDGVPSGLRVRSSENGCWQGSLDGPVEPLIAWLNGRRVEDLTIQRPDLETLFRRFYEEKEETEG